MDVHVETEEPTGDSGDAVAFAAGAAAATAAAAVDDVQEVADDVEQLEQEQELQWTITQTMYQSLSDRVSALEMNQSQVQQAVLEVADDLSEAQEPEPEPEGEELIVESQSSKAETPQKTIPRRRFL